MINNQQQELSTRMKIGFVVNHPTQFEVPFYQYVQKYEPTHQLDVFYLENNQQQDHYDKELGRSIRWGIDLYGGYSYYQLEGENKVVAFERFLQQKKYDIIVINGYKDQYSGFVEICKKHNIPVALRMDTVLFNQSYIKIVLRKLLLKKIYRQYDHFMVTGQVSRDYLHEMGIADEKINIFSYCTDNELFGKNDRNTDALQQLRNSIGWNGEKIILTVAKFMKRESPWDVLKAFTKLNRTDLMLVIVGDGVEKEALKNYAKQFPELKIRFTGYIPYTTLPQYYHISTLFIHAAKDEPWGVSVQEAIAGGCRVICSDKVGAAKDMITENVNGATYQFGNEVLLSQAIERVLAIDPKIVDAANKKVLNWWNYSSMWNEMLLAARKVQLQ